MGLLLHVTGGKARIPQRLSSPARREYGEGHWLHPRSKKTGLVVEDHFPITAEGFNLFVKRVYNPDNRSRGALLLMHGSWENGNLWRLHLNDGTIFQIDDMDRTDCVANWFASRGFDVFIPHLWGQRVYARYVERKYPDQHFRRVLQRNVSFDDIVSKDLPSLIDYVATFSENEKVFWIGHSFGGMLPYAYLAAHHEEHRITAVATLGSPIELGGAAQPALGMVGFSSAFFDLLGLVERNPLKLVNNRLADLSMLAARALVWSAPFSIFNGTLYEHKNVNPALIDPFLRKVAEPVPTRLIDFFLHMISSGRFCALPSSDGTNCDYGLAMGCVQTPFIVFAGEKDKVASLSGVEAAFSRLGRSEESQFRVLPGVGHLDLAVGKTVPKTMEEIQAFFAKWAIRRHGDPSLENRKGR